MKIMGMVGEVTKTAKAYKIKVDNHNYITQDSAVLNLSGKMVELEYEMSEPYNFNGKQVQSRLITAGTLKVQENKENKTPQILQPSGSADTPKTDWTIRNRQTDRGMLISYAKDLAIAGKIGWLQIPQVVETLFNCQYEVKTEEVIPF